MKGRVDSVTKSKSGKAWRVKIGDTFYGANFDSGISSSEVGQEIDFIADTTSFGPWIKSWELSRAAPPPPPLNPAPQGTYQATYKTNGDRWWLPFCSNQTANALAAGRIQSPGEMSAWTKAAYEAIQAVDALDR